MIFVLSDFMATGYETVLGRLARRHDVVALQLVDPRERELPAAGMVTLWDPETGAWRRVDTGDPAVRAYFARRAEEFDRGLDADAPGAGRGSAAAGDRAAVRGAAADVLPATGADAVAVTAVAGAGRAGGQAVGLDGRRCAIRLDRRVPCSLCAGRALRSPRSSTASIGT